MGTRCIWFEIQLSLLVELILLERFLYLVQSLNSWNNLRGKLKWRNWSKYFVQLWGPRTRLSALKTASSSSATSARARPARETLTPPSILPPRSTVRYSSSGEKCSGPPLNSLINRDQFFVPIFWCNNLWCWLGWALLTPVKVIRVGVEVKNLWLDVWCVLLKHFISLHLNKFALKDKFCSLGHLRMLIFSITILLLIRTLIYKTHWIAF